MSFYLTVRKLITFARAVSMEWRDWKPDCSGLTSEWETASVDNSLQTRGHLASGREGWGVLSRGWASEHLWLMSGPRRVREDEDEGPGH